MKVTRIGFLLVMLLAASNAAMSSDVAKIRAKSLGKGMNLSYLDHYWSGSKNKAFSDFAKESEVLKRRGSFKAIKKAGFDSVRIPINFGAWATIEKPYRWRDKKYLSFPDRFIKWAYDADLQVIVDLHHVEFDRSIPAAATTERIAWIWKQVSKRYKKYDPDRLMFELRNEPHDISAEEWRKQAQTLIKVVRKEAPDHTLVIGFHDWNSRTALVKSEPFKANNIIYTFHYYDPFIFTHQGATWAGDGLKTLRDIPFPYNKSKAPKAKESFGSWVNRQINNYAKNTKKSKMLQDLKEVKSWSERHDVPVFAGEFGSYSRFASKESRCRHAKTVYSNMKELGIPNAWWEWDGGFSMFEKGTQNISPCMRAAIESF